ncbi:MAG: pyridoxal phosphate-dependent aminotransferase [Clostridiales Family XIII bacterium]|nr:pyridoxal phosphate-dependent aminotransferase [Clostridiales Family XIII bacterium]
MKILKKTTKLDGVGYDIRGPVADEAARMTAEGIDIICLNTGNPARFGLFAPKFIEDAFCAGARSAEGYSDSQGIADAIGAICAYSASKGIEGVTPADVYTGNGVSELISITLQALLDNGDEILIPTPDYPLWTSVATLCGGKVVHYLCDEGAGWLPDAADIRRKVTPRTKAIVIINPNNPTGALYPEDNLLEILKIARENELVVFADEIYDRLVMDGLTHSSCAALAPDLFTVTFNGLSKSHMIAGFRCGWMVISGEKAHAADYIEGIHMLASMRLCANVPAQSVIRAALDEPFSAAPLIEPGGRIYEQREFIHRAINDIPGLSAVKPQAAFYLFPKIDKKKFAIKDDERFVLDFLHEHHVLLTHGGGFNWPDTDHFRIVYLPELTELRHIADRLRLFLETYHQEG